MRKKIKEGQKVAVSFGPRDRQLVLDHTFAGPDLTAALRRARLVDGGHVVRYTLGDLDELSRPADLGGGCRGLRLSGPVRRGARRILSQNGDPEPEGHA